MSDPIVIVSAVRTPIGSMQGELAGFQGFQLGAHAIKAAVERAGLKPEQVQEVIMGCVLPAGQGQAPARQATIHRTTAVVPAETARPPAAAGASHPRRAREHATYFPHRD